MIQQGWIEIVPGINRRTLAHGPRMMQIVATLEHGVVLPAHQHPHEQITHVISGRLRFELAGETHEVGPGESLYIASNVSHGALALEQTLALDTFSPPREDMLAQDAALTQ